MNTIIHTAVAYRDRLELEIGRIENFIRLAEELTSSDRAIAAGLAAPGPGMPGMPDVAAPIADRMVPSRQAETPAADTSASVAAPVAPAAPDVDEDDTGLVLRPEQPPESFPVPAVIKPSAPPANRATRGSLFRGACTSPEELRLAIAS